MTENSMAAAKSDFITALRIISHEGLSDAFAHLSARTDGGDEMLFMPRKSPALVNSNELFVVDFENPCRSRPFTRRFTRPATASKRFFISIRRRWFSSASSDKPFAPCIITARFFTKACRSIPEPGK